jgi:peroxiredoxin
MGSAVGTKTSLALLISLLLVALSATCKKGSPTSPDSPSALTFKGSISSGSQRLANVSVYLSWDASQSTQTNANGEFQFSGFSGSYFIITPSLVGSAFAPSNYELGRQSRSDLTFTAQPASFGSMENDIAADFSARNQSGQNVSLYQYFGEVVLIDFSADWCGPCRDEASHLESLYQNNKDKGFQIITLLISGSPADWADTYKLTFPVLDDNSESLWNIYGEGYIPLNIILDRNMTIRYKQSGYDESTITNTIKKYL